MHFYKWDISGGVEKFSAIQVDFGDLWQLVASSTSARLCFRHFAQWPWLGTFQMLHLMHWQVGIICVYFFVPHQLCASFQSLACVFQFSCTKKLNPLQVELGYRAFLVPCTQWNQEGSKSVSVGKCLFSSWSIIDIESKWQGNTCGKRTKCL